MRHLVIVESPSKCKTIEHYLGNNYRVIATCGHFRGLQSLDQINRSTLEITFKTTKPKIVKFLKEEIGIAKSVILATDDDREGEAIAWHICKIGKLPMTTPRIVFHEITSSAVQYAIQHPTTISLSRVRAQHARQLLDLYIGYSLSPLLWKAIKHTLSAGRCQTPALHMIAQQEEKVKDYSLQTSFRVKGYFTNKEIEFVLEKELSPEEMDPFFATIQDDFVLEGPEVKDVHLSPPPILTTSLLQQKASHALHLSPKIIMECAQTLYELGLLTYMRTDQSTYSQEFIQKAHDHLGNQFHRPLNKGEGAHEGIRITRFEIESTSIDKQTDRLYAFLYKYTLQTCMKPTILCHKIYKTKTHYQGLYFIHTSVSIQEKGWTDTTEKDWSSYLDHLKRFHCQHISADEQLSQEEFHWTEAQLIRNLEKHNIGRPSTYTHIVESLKDKKYVSIGTLQKDPVCLTQYHWAESIVQKTTVSKERKELHKLSITPLGKEVSDFCHVHFENVFNYTFSSWLEDQLDALEKEEPLQDSFLQDTLQKIDVLKTIPIQLKSYPSLHAGTYRNHPVVLKEGIYGYYMEYKNQAISLKDYLHYDCIQGWIRDQNIPANGLQELMAYREKNDNILLELNAEWSLRKGTYGNYLYYKTKKMKQPKFYKYTHGETKEEIEEYIQKKIKT